MTEQERLSKLQVPKGPVDCVLDTDTYNEIDDQFALSFMMKHEKFNVKALYAAPFFNNNSTSPEDGMEKSEAEIRKLLDFLGETREVFAGSRQFLQDEQTPFVSPAAEDLCRRAMAYSPEKPLYVVALGAITNIASALLMKPDIADRIVIIWLGGHALHWPNTREFNLRQDVATAQVVFDSKVPLALIPCNGVCSFLATSVPELQYYLGGKNEFCDYLVKIVAAYTSKPYAWSKVIWDVSAIALLTVPEALETVILPTPVLTDDCYFANDTARHPFIYVRHLKRDAIFAHLFKKLAGEA